MNLHLGRLQNQHRKVNNLFMFARIFAQDLPIQVQDYSAAGLPRVIRTMQIAFNDRIEAKLPYMDIPTLVVRDEKDLILSNGKLNVIPDGGHTLNYSKAVELSRVCQEFIQETVADLITGSVQ